MSTTTEADLMDDTERPPTRALSESECWALLRDAPYGRIATGAAGQIDIFPVNHRVGAGALVFRTAAGTKLLELTIRHDVAFEIDGTRSGEAFSVVVKGMAEEFDRSADIAAAETMGIRPWAPEDKDRWVRIMPESVQGRAFALPAAGDGDVSKGGR